MGHACAGITVIALVPRRVTECPDDGSWLGPGIRQLPYSVTQSAAIRAGLTHRPWEHGSDHTAVTIASESYDEQHVLRYLPFG